MDYPDTRMADASGPERIQELDSLDVEGNTSTNQETLSSQVHPVDGHLDKKRLVTG